MLKLFGLILRVIVGATVGFSIATIFFVAYKQHDAAEKYKAHRETYCASIVAPTEQKKSCAEEGTSAKDYLAWGYDLISWPEGITTWAILLTLGAIAWQSYETHRAAKATEDAAIAAQATVEAMERQHRSAREKERARIEVRIVPDELPITQILWQVKFQVRNIGPTHAFNVWVFAKFDFTTSFIPPPIPEPRMLKHLPRIRAEKWRHVFSGPLYWGDDEGGSNQARMQEVADGKLFLHMRGTVDYQDIWGEPHVTPFRYLWNANIDTPSWGDLTPRWFEAVHGADPKAT